MVAIVLSSPPVFTKSTSIHKSPDPCYKLLISSIPSVSTPEPQWISLQVMHSTLCSIGEIRGTQLLCPKPYIPPKPYIQSLDNPKPQP